MSALAQRHQDDPDAKILGFLSWVRENQCPAAALDPEDDAGKAWSGTRVIVFTESMDTKSYIQRQLQRALAHTEDGHQRVMVFHGGLGDDTRAEIQQAFNSPPDEHPVRILIATDAAREGINLQGHCADLFHYDVPWNPARMEQRNGASTGHFRASLKFAATISSIPTAQKTSCSTSSRRRSRPSSASSAR